MIKKLALAFCISFLFISPSLAQDQKAQVAELLRVEDDRPVEALILTHLVDLDMDPGWWALMLDPSDTEQARLNLAFPLGGIREYTEGGYTAFPDLAELDSKTGGKGESPLLNQQIQGLQGHIRVGVSLKFAPSLANIKHTVAGIGRVGSPLRAAKDFNKNHLDVSFIYDPASLDVGVAYSEEQRAYDFKLPALTSWSQYKAKEPLQGKF